MTKEEKIEALLEMLNECLEGGNQECYGSLECLSFDEEKGEVVIKFPLVVIEEDNFVGFQGY